MTRARPSGRMPRRMVPKSGLQLGPQWASATSTPFTVPQPRRRSRSTTSAPPRCKKRRSASEPPMRSCRACSTPERARRSIAVQWRRSSRRPRPPWSASRPGGRAPMSRSKSDVASSRRPGRRRPRRSIALTRRTAHGPVPKNRPRARRRPGCRLVRLRTPHRKVLSRQPLGPTAPWRRLAGALKKSRRSSGWSATTAALALMVSWTSRSTC
mmetsp:Transcript_1097/g.2272  ORF Transcript_1097/g.2272 Transcript_1097/m.2272 type:complete len:212 (-) Transcript_1097:1020-1655(-)